MRMRGLLAWTGLVATVAAAAPSGAGVSINGVAVAGAESRPSITVDITEFREGGGNMIQLLPGAKRYGVSLVTRERIATLDTQFPLLSEPATYTISTEVGQTFKSCIVTSLSSEGSGGSYRLVYALRCADVN